MTDQDRRAYRRAGGIQCTEASTAPGAVADEPEGSFRLHIQADVPCSKLVKPPHGQHRRQFRFGAPHVLIQA